MPGGFCPVDRGPWEKSESWSGNIFPKNPSLAQKCTTRSSFYVKICTPIKPAIDFIRPGESSPRPEPTPPKSWTTSLKLSAWAYDRPARQYVGLEGTRYHAEWCKGPVGGCYSALLVLTEKGCENAIIHVYMGIVLHLIQNECFARDRLLNHFCSSPKVQLNLGWEKVSMFTVYLGDCQKFTLKLEHGLAANNDFNRLEDAGTSKN